MNKKIRLIACLKALRGSAALLVGVALFITYNDSETFAWAQHSMIKNFALNDPVFQILINWVAEFSKEQVLIISLLAFTLGILRYIESAGIWLHQGWAQKLSVLTGSIYIPFELHELVYRFSWLMLLILAINLVVVTYLLHVLRMNRKTGSTQRLA